MVFPHPRTVWPIPGPPKQRAPNVIPARIPSFPGKKTACGESVFTLYRDDFVINFCIQYSRDEARADSLKLVRTAFALG